MINKWLNKVVLGDNKELLKQLPDNSIECVATDPPYGLSDYDDIVAMIKSWIETGDYDHKKKGFMGKSWDGCVPAPNTWKEVYRVMKPGAYGLVFAGTRTQDIMGLSLRLAGFELRDVIMYLHGQGFPKSRNIWETDIRPEVETQLRTQGFTGAIVWE